MSGPAIDQTLSSAAPLSVEVSGAKIALEGIDREATGTAQVVREADTGDFEVHLECGVQTLTGVPRWDPIAVFDQEGVESTEQSNITTFPVSAGAMFRLRHVSGVACRVLLVG